MTGLHAVGLTIVAAMLRAVPPLAVVGAAVLLIGLVIRSAGKSPFLGRIERKPLMTSAEVRFWHILQSALPEYRIFGQVAVGALLKPVAGLSGKDWWSTYGRFSQKIVDFVVNQRTGDVLAVVELDDHSHNAASDAARDALLARGGYRVVRFTGRDGSVEVRHRFAALIERDYDDGVILWRPRAVS